MIRTILIISAFAISFSLFSQAHSFFYLGGGLTGSTTRLKGLNDVIDRYNETRQGGVGQADLIQELEHFHGQSGYEFSFGGIQDDLGFFADLHLSFMNAESFAEGYNLDGTLARRELEYESVVFSGGVGASIIQNNFLEFGAGLSVDITWDKIYSKVNDEALEEIFEEEVPVAFSPFAQAHLFLSRKIPLALFGRGFVQLPLLKSDFYELNKELNPATYVNDGEGDFKSLSWRPGFTIGVAFIFHERDLSFTR